MSGMRPSGKKGSRKNSDGAPAILDLLVDRIMSDDEAVCLQTIAMVNQTSIPDVIKLIFARLAKKSKSRSPSIRAKASRGLALLTPRFRDLYDPAADLPHMIDFLKDPDPVIRREAARRLGQLNAAAIPAVPALTTLVDDADEETRLAVRDALFVIRQYMPE